MLGGVFQKTASLFPVHWLRYRKPPSRVYTRSYVVGTEAYSTVKRASDLLLHDTGHSHTSQWFHNKMCEGSFVVSCLKEKHMMPLHTAHEQVITLKRELTRYDCDEILIVSELTSWHYTSPVVTCQYLVIMFSSLTYGTVCPANTPFSSSPCAAIG